MKKVLAVLFLTISMFLVLENQDRANAWIGTGTGGSGGGWSDGGGSGSCKNDYLWMYAVDCAGVSWAYYKVNKVTNKDVKFPGLSNEPTNIDAIIPAECSKAGGGFWHFGINSFGVRVMGDGLYTGGYYGHWSTMNAGHDVAKWAPYSIVTNLNGKEKQKIGDAYVLDHYGYASDALRAYQQVYASTYPGKTIPNAIPGNVWGFCWDPTMDVNEFQGRSAVQKTDNSVSWYNAMEKKRTDWVGNEEGKVNEVDLEVECNDENGCNVSFRHFMRRTAGSGGSKYTVTRKIVEGEISASDVSFKVDHSDAFDWSGSKNGVGGEGTVYTIAKGTLTAKAIDKYKIPTDNSVFLGKSAIRMTPGDKICETLKFESESGKNSGWQTTTVCATVKNSGSSVGEEANATIVMEVKNEDVDGFKEYSGGVMTYAKPSDTVSFRAVYNPAPQAVYNECENNAQNCNKNWTTTYSWKNGFLNRAMRYWGSERYGDINIWDTYTYGLGESSTIEQETHKYTIPSNYVGTAIIEYAIINPMNDDGNSLIEKVWTTPTSYKKIENNIEVYADLLQSYARVMIPYNFNTEVSVSGDDEVVYAGEPKDVGYEVKTTERWNETTEGTYKTIVRESKVKTVAYIGEGEVKMGTDSFDGGSGVNVNLCEYFGGDDVSCDESEVQDFGDLNDSKNGSRSVRIPDVPAGTQVCVAAAVYPANSGYDRNMSKDGSDTWRISDSKCYKVAKKPSVQVWGGSVYSGGNISAPLAKKTDLAGYSWDGEMRMFGSWAEWSVVHNGSNLWLASGAGLGYVSNNNGTLWPAVHPDDGNGNISNNDKGSGGNSGNDFCKVSTLTFPNSDCIISISGVSSGGGGSLNIDIDEIKETIENIQEVTEVSGGEIEGSVVYFSGSDITISGDIKLKDDVSYTSLDAMPKVIIYAGGSININPNVERIDAVLIAKSGDIDTCSIDEDNQSYSKDCSRQLSINGALIAGGEVKFNRTYGAATGANSMVPAEIINYNPALYFLKIGGSSTSSQSTIWEQVYTRELAPRY